MSPARLSSPELCPTTWYPSNSKRTRTGRQLRSSHRHWRRGYPRWIGGAPAATKSRATTPQPTTRAEIFLNNSSSSPANRLILIKDNRMWEWVSSTRSHPSTSTISIKTGSTSENNSIPKDCRKITSISTEHRERPYRRAMACKWSPNPRKNTSNSSNTSNKKWCWKCSCRRNGKRSKRYSKIRAYKLTNWILCLDSAISRRTSHSTWKMKCLRRINKWRRARSRVLHRIKWLWPRLISSKSMQIINLMMCLILLNSNRSNKICSWKK